jgi:uncharacterized protein (DUF924 family)
MATGSARSAADLAVSARFSRLTCLLATDPGYRARWLSPSSHASPSQALLARVAAIVVLDQFPRHLRRLPGCALPPPAATDALALAITASLLSPPDPSHPSLPHPSLPLPHHVFSLMPLRHSDSPPLIARAVEEVGRLEERLEEGDRKLLGRFRKASARRLQAAQDKARGAAPAGGEYAAGDILEQGEFEGDLSGAKEGGLVGTVERFLLATHGHLGGAPKAGKVKGGARRRGSGAAPPPSPPAEPTPVLVSLSGGVDSMVVARILVHLRPR